MGFEDNQLFFYSEFDEGKRSCKKFAVTSNLIVRDEEIELGRITDEHLDSLSNKIIEFYKNHYGGIDLSLEILYNSKYVGEFTTDGTGPSPFLYVEKGVNEKSARKLVSLLEEKGISSHCSLGGMSLGQLFK
jgi:hypothetical protein